MLGLLKEVVARLSTVERRLAKVGNYAKRLPWGIGQGGTGAKNAADARDNLGLGSGDSPSFAGLSASGQIYQNDGDQVASDKDLRGQYVGGVPSSEKPSFFPQGSSCALAQDSSWPTSWGLLWVYKYINNRATQMLSAQEGDSLFMRTAKTTTGSNEWLGWHRIALDAPASASGYTIVSPNANSPTSKTVTLPSGRFSATPNIVVTANTSLPGSTLKEVSRASASTSSFKIVIYRTDSNPTGVDWIAMENH